MPTVKHLVSLVANLRGDLLVQNTLLAFAYFNKALSKLISISIKMVNYDTAAIKP